MRRLLAPLVALAACGPSATTGTGDDADPTSSSGSDATTSDPPTATGVQTGGDASTDTGTPPPPMTTDDSGGKDSTGPPPFSPNDCGGWVGDCNDGMDNDGDGLIDLGDPECLSPCDNDEGLVGTYFVGDSAQPCLHDCAFDENSGMGDDMCRVDLVCDPLEPFADLMCEYMPADPDCGQPVDPQCLDYCLPRTPNGCDCYGCCQIPGLPEPRFMGLYSPCDLEDPSTCPPCTMDTTCVDPCDQPCEVCVGDTTPPPGCARADCDGDELPCTVAADGVHDCPDGTYCVTGCCLPEV